MPRVRDKLGVARMIDSFHADDDLRQLGRVLVDVFDQFGLGVGWSGNQNSAGVSDRLSDRLEEVVIFRRVTGADGVCLVVNVPGRMLRMERQFFDIGRAEMKDAGLVVIDPDDCVKVMGAHTNSFDRLRTTLSGWWPYG